MPVQTAPAPARPHYLGQIVAVTQLVQGRHHAEFTALHRAATATAENGPLNGVLKTYRPLDDDGETLPSQRSTVQTKIEGGILVDAAELLRKLFDTVATRDWGNCIARGDLIVDGTVLVADAPVSWLLWLEKQLIDIHTFVEKLPTLDPGQIWRMSDEADCWATVPVETVRTKKIPRNHEVAPATAQHPAQVQVYTEDETVGRWTMTRFSGAIPAARRRQLLGRVDELQHAVKFAREAANATPVPAVHVGEQVLGYLFAA